MEQKKEKKVAPKKEKRARPHWNKCVEAFFEFCEDRFGEKPTFDHSAPRDLGFIMDAIEKKTVEKQMLYTEDIAVRSLKLFLLYCFNDQWLQKNFILFNLNRQKDKIFFKIKSDIDAKRNPGEDKPKQFGSHKTAGQDIFAERLRGRLEKKFKPDGN